MKIKHIAIILIVILSLTGGMIFVSYENYQTSIYISELETEIEDKDQKITELEHIIEELEYKSEKRNEEIKYLENVNYLSQQEKNQYSIDTAVPYDIIKSTEFEKYIYEYIPTYTHKGKYVVHGSEFNNVRVKIQGYNNILNFYQRVNTYVLSNSY